MKILFTGGGTGGHVFPIIAIIREIKKMTAPGQVQLLYMGPKDLFTGLFLPQEGVKVKGILAGKIRRILAPKQILLNFFDVFKFIIGTIQAFFWIFIESPDIVFSKGGYGSVSTVISAKILQVPVFLHESDIIPGLANRILGKLASEIFVSFPKTEYFKPEKMVLVGNPIRKELLLGSPEKAKALFNLTGEKPVLLVMGSSQGAQRINDLLLLILTEILKDFEILHQTGMRNFKQVKSEVRIVMKKGLARYYHPIAFFREHELREALAAADIIVSRASAGAIFEIAGAGLPSVLIPLPESAQNHQISNAYAYSYNGAAEVMEEVNLTPHFFLERLRFLISQPEQLKKMSLKAKKFARPKAGAIIAQYILEYLGI